MRKILYISGTRADYGLMRRALSSIRSYPGLSIEIAATGMHLMPGFGRTINDIYRDKFKVHCIQAVYDGCDRESMARFIGKFTLLLVKALKQIKPDIILVLGDRSEMLAAAIVGVYLGIPVAHIHGGDVSSTVDEISRHAITKLAHIHLAATPASAARIAKMGEDHWRIYTVGAPGLDGVRSQAAYSPREIAKIYGLDLSLPLLLVAQHPVSAELKDASRQMQQTLRALAKLKAQAILIYPNADAGANSMIRVIEKYRRFPFIKIYKSIPRSQFISLMNIASMMLGNSSSAIIEAPEFGLRAVNIGSRQDGRERADNIIDCGYNAKEILRSARSIIRLNKAQKKRGFNSPYHRGGTGTKIARILKSIKIDQQLLQKRIAY